MNVEPTRPTLRVARVLTAVTVILFALPIVGLLSRVPLADLGSQVGSAAVREALGLSLFVSVAATLLAAVLGLPLAWVLARERVPGRDWIRGLVTLPMVLPPVVAGVGLLTVFGRKGLLGGLGLDLAFSTTGAVIAAAFVSAPFLVLTVEGALRQTEPRFEAAAATLGASDWRIVTTVILPQIKPGLIAGLALCWARALGEFGATITFAGNFPGRTQTLPLAVYRALQTDFDAAIAVSMLLLVVALTVLVALRGRLAP